MPIFFTLPAQGMGTVSCNKLNFFSLHRTAPVGRQFALFPHREVHKTGRDAHRRVFGVAARLEATGLRRPVPGSEERGVGSMRIVTCPKGGRIPEGYCRQSCLNYPGPGSRSRWQALQRFKRLFVGDGRSWLQVYKEDIASRREKGSAPF
jgi:hypothetical protein